MDKIDEDLLIFIVSIILLTGIILLIIYKCLFYENEFDKILSTNNYKVIAHDITGAKYGTNYVLTIQDNVTGKIISQQVNGTGYYTILNKNNIK